MAREAEMARPERFELPTARFVAEYSIQLSYGRIVCSRLKPLPHLCLFGPEGPPTISHFNSGGERGIRTLEGVLALTPLAGERFRPLSHLSVTASFFAFVVVATPHEFLSH